MTSHTYMIMLSSHVDSESTLSCVPQLAEWGMQCAECINDTLYNAILCWCAGFIALAAIPSIIVHMSNCVCTIPNWPRQVVMDNNCIQLLTIIISPPLPTRSLDSSTTIISYIHTCHGHMHLCACANVWIWSARRGCMRAVQPRLQYICVQHNHTYYIPPHMPPIPCNCKLLIIRW